MLTSLQCDQPGHVSRECTEAKDWSKVKCRREYNDLVLYRSHADVSADCGEHGHASETRCNPEKKAAYAAAQAAAAGDEDGGTNDFSNGGTAGGDDGWNQSGNDFGGSGQASWENSAAPSTPAVTVGNGGW